eukprot:gene17257-20566_t
MYLNEQSKKVSAEEDIRRRALSDRFNSTVKDVSERLEEFNQQNQRQSNYIDLLQNKIKSLEEHHDNSKAQFETLFKKAEVETKLLEVKMRQQLDTEIIKNKAYRDQLEKLLKEDIILREKVKFYEENMDQYKEAFSRSTEMYASFKVDMERAYYHGLLQTF